jgi:uncharacterized membrane protein YgdD (TMEM256/DUF423 family)
MQRFILAFAGLAGAASVAGDAASRHLLGDDPTRADWASTSAHYGLAHALALLALAGLWNRLSLGRARHALVAAAWCFIGGIILFCGGLGLMASGFSSGPAPAVPIGGTLFILGWLAAFVAGLAPVKEFPPSR